MTAPTQAHAVAAVRAAEAAGIAEVGAQVLMQRAAAAVAAAVAERLRERTGGVYGRRVVLLVGPGGNGGDAAWAGAWLRRRGVRVDAVLCGDRTHPGAIEGLLAAGGRVVPPSDAATTGRALLAADVVVDGLAGLGSRPGLGARAAELVDAIPADACVVAVDLPSGVDPDTGETPGPHVHADVTVTFGTAKACLLLPPASEAAGAVVVADIGLPADVLGAPVVRALSPGQAARAWPVPGPTDDKYSRGVLGVVAGGRQYPGAAVLATGAAVAAGTGMVRYLGPAGPADAVRAAWPEVVAVPGRVQAWVLGPGVDPADPEQAARVRAALAGTCPCVVDAGALDLLGACRAGATLLTPHAGELARLLTRLGTAVTRREVLARPLHHARLAATATGATVLLKGATTVVVGPDGAVLAQPDGPPWLATAGTGDVLAGIAGALLAAGRRPPDAGALAVLVHATAGRRASGGGPLTASSVLAQVPGAVASLLTATGPPLGD